MLRASVAGRCHIDLAGIGLRISDKFRHRFGRSRWIHHHDIRPTAKARDRDDVADEVEIELLVKRGVDRVCRTYQQQRVAIGRRAYHRLGADVGAGTWTVLDDKSLAEPL